MKIGNALRVLAQTAWAMEPNVLQSMADIFARHANGVRLSEEEIAANIVEARLARGQSADVPDAPPYTVRNGTAVIPIFGVIAKRASMVNGSSQPEGTSAEEIRRDLRAALADPDVANIVLRVDSPGGSVDGVADLADEIRAADDRKPVLAYADGMMASAAYWLAAGARQITVSKDAVVGSIGVYSVAVDTSRLHENHGVKVNVIRSAPMKGAGTRGAAITNEQVRAVQERVDALHDLFTDAVAAGRKLPMADVEALADGDVRIGQLAVDAKLADRVGTLEDLLGGLQTSAPRRRRSASAQATEQGDPPMSDATKPAQAAASQVPAAPVASIKELKALEGADADFVVAQFEKGATLAEAREALQAREVARLKAENEELKKTQAAAQPKKPAGVQALQADKKETAEGASAGDPRAEFFGKVDELVEAGMPRDKAVSRVAGKHPELHRAMLEAANADAKDGVDAYFKN